MSTHTLVFDIHCHTNADPLDGKSHPQAKVQYSPYQAIDQAHKKGITHLALTHHESLLFDPDWQRYAQAYGIVLIPGFEATIQGAHVVLLWPTTDNITTFAQLHAHKKSNPQLFVLAPHPYYPVSFCLGDALIKHAQLFDAVEFASLHIPYITPFNAKASTVAKQLHKPLIATSDAHSINQIGSSYTSYTVQKKPRTVSEIRKILCTQGCLHHTAPSIGFLTRRIVDLFL
jgi:predicted metal-dependent phosphoesterase TrpH